MRTRNVVLTDRYDRLIDDLVKAGRYQNASEVMRDGLRLVEAREAEAAAKLKRLRAAVKVGLDQLDAGQGQYFETTGDLRSYLDTLLSTSRKSRRQRAR